jgi:hypothetical protein
LASYEFLLRSDDTILFRQLLCLSVQGKLQAFQGSVLPLDDAGIRF